MIRKNIHTIVIISVSLNLMCKKETIPLQKEIYNGYYILNEPKIENIRNAMERSGGTSTSKSTISGYGCTQINLDQNKLSIYFPVTEEKFEFEISAEPENSEKIKVETFGKLGTLHINNKGEVESGFGNGKKISTFANKPILSLNDCKLLPIQVTKDCRKGIIPNTYYISEKNGSAIRSTPAFEGEVLEKLPNGEIIKIAQVEENSSQWVKVEHNGKSGFIYKDSYSAAPKCYDENTAIQKIIDFTTLYNNVKFLLPFETHSDHIPNYALKLSQTFMPDKSQEKDSKNQISKLPFSVLVSPGPEALEYTYKIDSFQIRNDDVLFRLKYSLFEYEGGTDKPRMVEYYNCLVYKNDILKISPWNNEVHVSECSKE